MIKTDRFEQRRGSIDGEGEIVNTSPSLLCSSMSIKYGYCERMYPFLPVGAGCSYFEVSSLPCTGKKGCFDLFIQRWGCYIVQAKFCRCMYCMMLEIMEEVKFRIALLHHYYQYELATLDSNAEN